VEETEVGVEVDAGVVTLTGTVNSWAKRVAAQEAAHRVAGVLDVANDIHVKAPNSAVKNDTDIAHAVRQALSWNDFVAGSRIRFTVADGIVTLNGEVDYGAQREDAEKSVSVLSGVRGIINEIQIRPPESVREDLKGAIEDALERRAERTAKHVSIDVLDGQVRLAGTLHSWAEWQAVLGAVKGTPGVRGVDDRTHILPYAD
jgi:osmotically-inducible protein OsmY